MRFIGNFIFFSAQEEFENRSRFGKVITKIQRRPLWNAV